MSGTDDPAALAAWLAAMPGGAAIPFSTSPPGLYDARTLYDGYDPAVPGSLAHAFDSRVYAWTREPGTLTPRTLGMGEVIAARLHDTAIDRLIAGFLDAPHQKTVGFMGGHSIPRTAVAFRRTAGLARSLRRRGFMIVTGGGPGLMEAANFGAFMAPFDDAAFDPAIRTLCAAPDFADKDPWVAAAARVRAGLLGAWDAEAPPESANLGVPTWVYGFEPPNLFATATGKYFYNSLREDGLVTIANGGLVFGRGDAGTVQEVFQNAVLNYYRAPGVEPTPMVFLSTDYWNPTAANDAGADPEPDPHRKPVFPLIHKLAVEAAQPFDAALLLSDDPEAVADFITKANAPGRTRVADERLAVC